MFVSLLEEIIVLIEVNTRIRVDVSILTTLIIPISVCYYWELHSAIMSYSGVLFATNESSIGCLDIIEQI